MPVGLGGVLDAECDRADRRAVQAREALGERIGFGVDDEVDAALAVQRDVFVAVTRDGRETHLLEQFAERLGVRCGVFDEFKAVGAQGIFKKWCCHTTPVMGQVVEFPWWQIVTFVTI